MAVKNYIINNKKKSTCIIMALLMLVIAMFVIIYVKNANAGVFVKDENGDRVQTNHIQVLEIVAQEGQQVLGYTVKGQEPITVEKIESYRGSMDIDIDDFKNATGFVLSKTKNGDGTFSYKVERSLLNDTFNKNVLGDSMEDGEITVKAVQANELTLGDIKEANLIFINSNDYNDNLLYYYDQIMMDGTLGYAQGDKGVCYADTYLSEELKVSIGIKNICAAAGNKTLAELLTEEDFVNAGVESYSDVYLKNCYQKKIAELEPEYFNSDSEEETLEKINEFISGLNEEEKNQVFSEIRSLAGTEISETDKEKVGYYLSAGGWSGYNERNLDKYCEALASASSALTSYMVQQNIINNPNGTATLEAVRKLGTYKFNMSGDEINFTEEEMEDIRNCFMVLNSGNVKESLLTEYVNTFFDVEFVYTNPTVNVNKAYEELKTLVSNVNTTMQAEVLNELADAAGDADKTADFVASAYSKFDIADIDGYNKYNLDDYIAELEKITDKNAFRPDNSEDAGFDLEKIKNFISDTNAEALTKTVTRSYDLAWTQAMELYAYAMVDEKGLMYNTELLTKNVIGDYTQDLANVISGEEETITPDNTNNMYKLLLLMRQIQYPYYRDNIASKIDDLGVYYPDGVDADGNFIGTGVTGWYKETFGNDFTNYAKYHEPDVVGKTYSESGLEGAERNYVYKRIYSFTGAQFFGGESFVATDLGDIDTSKVGVVTLGTGYSDSGMSGIEPADFDENSRHIFLNTKLVGWSNPGVWAWKTGSNGSWIKATLLDADEKLFGIEIPEDIDNVLFTGRNGSFTSQTDNIALSGNFGGTLYYITARGKYTAYSCGLSTSIKVDTSVTSPSEEQIVKYTTKAELKFTGSNVTNASYKIDNGEWISINLDDKITIGEGVSVGELTNIRLKYDTYNGDSAELSYWYQKIGDSYNVSISNIINGSVVEYYGKMDVNMTYQDVTDFEYSIDGGEFQAASSGESITIGEGLAEGTRTTLTFRYKAEGVEKTVITTLSKKMYEYDSTEANYLSTKTATAIDRLTADRTLSDTVNSILINGNKGDIVRYIMDVTLNEIQRTLNILEIQPAAAVTELDNEEGAKRLAEYLNLDITDDLSKKANRDKYFNITYMSVKEFNTRNDDLAANYDLIYIGINSGYTKVNRYTLNGTTFYRTQYNDATMNGLVYTGIGDEYNVVPMMRGVAADDFEETNNTITSNIQKKEVGYWKNYYFDGFTGSFNYLDATKNYVLKSSNTTTRLSGADLTVLSKDRLIDYLKSGYPILLEDEIMNCDSNEYVKARTTDNINDASVAAKWKWVDENSKMYAFVQEAKNLGKNAAGVYDGLSADGNQVFSDGKTYPSLVSVTYAANGRNPANLDDNHKMEGGLSFAMKRISRVEFELIDGPTEYNYVRNADGTKTRVVSVDGDGNWITGNVISKESPEYKSYKFVLNVETNVTPEWLAENYSYQIYIDRSGVGKFEEDYTIQIYPGVEYQYSEDGKLQAVISGNWPDGLEGFVPWKLEAYNNSNPELKFSYRGFSVFANQSKKKDVFVLWVRHEHSKGLTLNFRDSVNEHQDAITDYTVHIVSMTYTQFVRMWEGENDDTVYTADNSKLKVKSTVKHMKDNGYYNERFNLNLVDENGDEIELPDTEFNMLVFGFSDSYVGLDINNINALKNIESFINAGNSLLFTHDGASYLSTMNYYTNTSGKRVDIKDNWNWGRYTTAYMRGMLGMDLYGITYSSDSLPESAVNARKYLSDDITAADLRGFTEGCVFKYTVGGKGNQLYTSGIKGGVVTGITDWQYAKGVMKVNQGQITEYPFVLDTIIPTATTHTQYMQLDLEDSDTTVWYTLDNANGGAGFYKYTKGDGANNYYIYSNGNITYTGSGHSWEETPTTQEQQLFINTVIFALKAGNLAPKVDFPDAYTKTDSSDNYVEYYPNNPDSKGLILTFKPTDYYKNDGETNVFSHCRIYIDVNNDGAYTEGTDILLNDTDSADGYNNTHKYIWNTSGTEEIMIQAEEIVNTGYVSFLIPKTAMEEMASVNPNFKNIFAHKIYVEVTNNGTKTNVNAKMKASNSVMIEKKEYVDPQYMNLN